MDYIVDGIKEAIILLTTFDSEIYEIIGMSIFVSGISTILSSIYSIPLGIYLGIIEIKRERFMSKIIYTMMSVPTVIVGLIVAISIARNGPLGKFGFMYTPTGMIIAQTILLTPLITGLTYGLAKTTGAKVKETCETLGGRKKHIIVLMIKELSPNLKINVVSGFSRAISEVGAVMIVGGNIKGQTRVITTAISMLNSMGDYSKAIALGIVLLILSFVVNSIVYNFKVEN